MKELLIRFTASAFSKLLSVYVFSYFPFGFQGRIWDLIVSVPDHCLSFYFEKDLNNKDPDEQTQNTVGLSDLGPETDVKNGQDKKRIPVIESQIDNVPNATDDESEDDEEIVVIQTTNVVVESTEVDASDVSTEIIVPEGSDAGSQSSKTDGLMNAEDALDPDHQDDPMSLEDAQLSD